MVLGGYENTMQAIINHMVSVGYRLMDITDINRSPLTGALWLLELAFIRSDSPMLEQCAKDYQ